MENYFIKYFVDVVEDDYNEGEKDQVNYYDGNGYIDAENVKDAIKQFFEKNLCFEIDVDSLESLQDENLQRYTYSVLCDVDNEQIIDKSSYDFKEWEKGNILLYTNNINFNIFKLAEIKSLV